MQQFLAKLVTHRPGFCGRVHRDVLLLRASAATCRAGHRHEEPAAARSSDAGRLGRNRETRRYRHGDDRGFSRRCAGGLDPARIETQYRDGHIEAFDRVIGLFTAKDIRAEDEDMLVEPAIDALPENAAEVTAASNAWPTIRWCTAISSPRTSSTPRSSAFSR